MEEMVVENVESTETQLDNSETEVDTEPSFNGDNSKTDVNEPNTSGSDKTDSFQGKFSNLDDANKSYSELEKKLGQQSSELGELRKQAEEVQKLREQLQVVQLQKAQENGFNTVQEYETSKEIANYVADEYLKFISEVEYPDDIVEILNAYRNNPSKELLDSIESEFSLETIKKVAGAKELFKGQLEEKENQALMEEVKASISNYLSENIEKYQDRFDNPEFQALYGEAFRMIGCDMNTDLFIKLLDNYTNSIIASQGITKKINEENSSETDKIAGLTSGSSVNHKANSKSLLEMSNEELDARLEELI